MVRSISSRFNRTLRRLVVAWQHINFYGRYEFTKAPALINMDGIIAELAQQTIVPSEDDG